MFVGETAVQSDGNRARETVHAITGRTIPFAAHEPFCVLFCVHNILIARRRSRPHPMWVRFSRADFVGGEGKIEGWDE